MPSATIAGPDPLGYPNPSNYSAPFITLTAGATGTVSPVSQELSIGLYFDTANGQVGFVGDTSAGFGGGTAGSINLTLSVFNSRADAKGFYIAQGGSFGEGLCLGADMIVDREGSPVGYSGSIGLGGGLTPAEGHVRFGVTGF